MTNGSTAPISLRVNGNSVYAADVAPRTHLADFLRERLLLTGTHLGCEHGICGACTVTINGEIARSCITYAVACNGADVRTIEGFADDPLMARLRTAFSAEHALQCGYCTPGMLVAARDLVRRKGGQGTALSRAQIRMEMSGNLCRCTGYVGIVSAIESVMLQRDVQRDATPASPVGTWLGPAPGPGSDHRPDRGLDHGPHHGLNRGPGRRRHWDAPRPVAARTTGGRHLPIPVTVGAIEQRDGATWIAQSFVLQHPLEAVWQLMADPHAIARCMPGLSLDATGSDPLAATTMQNERASARGLTPIATRAKIPLNGRLVIGIGPIAASFAGEGTLTQIAAEHRQTIEGHGGDRKSGSRVSGAIDYRLTRVAGAEGSQATRVDAAMSYVLTGPLAQIGRSAIVRDLVARIGEAFAQNLDAQLIDPSAAIPAAQLSGISLLLRVLADRVHAIVAHLTGRG